MIRVLDIHITGKARMTFMEIDDMKQETKTTVKQPAEETAPEPKAKKAAPKKAKKERRAYSRFDADQKADIIRRYKAGEGPKAISESLGCSRSLITHIIHDAGAVEGRTGAHLNKGREKEPAQEPIPEPVQETVSEIEETESERDKRLKKERIEWQKNHPNKW
jgi:hypothetical protein